MAKPIEVGDNVRIKSAPLITGIVMKVDQGRGKVCFRVSPAATPGSPYTLYRFENEVEVILPVVRKFVVTVADHAGVDVVEETVASALRTDWASMPLGWTVEKIDEDAPTKIENDAVTFVRAQRKLLAGLLKSEDLNDADDAVVCQVITSCDNFLQGLGR